MKRIFIIILLVAVNTSLLSAQNMKTLLRSMPENVFPILTHNNILDFIDFLDVKMKAEVDNRLGGKSEMTQLSDSTASIRLTPNSEATLSITEQGGEKLIQITHQYHTPTYNNSTTTFYTPDWKKKE